jgi:hypothetical protein
MVFVDMQVTLNVPNFIYARENALNFTCVYYQFIAYDFLLSL